MPARNLKQATIIPSGTILPNPRGTAPGWWVENGDGIVVAMPGAAGRDDRDVGPTRSRRDWPPAAMAM